MGKIHDTIDPSLQAWIERQHVVFVGTAALAADATVNVSPKGMAGTFVVLDGTTCAYQDLTGSGIETVAHLRENGRITLMWCAFDGPARIVRIHGRGTVVGPDDERWDELSSRFEPSRGQRAIIMIEADRISDSCGYSVPKLDFVEDRTRLSDWTDARTDDELAAYRDRKNAASIDGLPGL